MNGDIKASTTKKSVRNSAISYAGGFVGLNSVNWTPVLDSVLAEIATIEDNTIPNQNIAEAAIQLAGFDVYYENIIENKLFIRAEFDGFQAYQYDPCFFESWLHHVAPHAIAHKEVNTPQGNKTVVVITIRGTGMEHDRIFAANALLSDVTFGYNWAGWEHDEHRGFYLSADTIWNYLTEDDGSGEGYLDRYELGDPSNNKDLIFLITGHSRGASVANLLSARIYDECFEYDVGDDTDISKRVFSYDFATPPVIKIGARETEAYYQNIFHIDNNQDTMINKNMFVNRFEHYGKAIKFNGGEVDGVASGGHRAEIYQKWVYEGLPDVIENWNN